MTILTQVQPGRDTSAERESVPWRGMLWVTWRQHRGLLTSVPAVFVAAVAFMLVTGPKIHRDYAILTACHPAASPACVQLSNYFNSTDLSVLTPPVFGTRALSYAAWTLTAFCLGAFLGLLTRGIIPAMAATLAVYAALAALTWFYRGHRPPGPPPRHLGQ
jgi:hypothetical protein